MTLSNAQYDHLMRTYEKRQLDNEHRLHKNYETACLHIPELARLDDAIASCSIAQARLLLDGDVSALDELKEQISRLSIRKRELLVAGGFPEDYLEPHYFCPDCKDTGYIATDKCHCFKKAIVDLLYMQSNLQDVLERENFSTFSFKYYSSHHIDPATGRSALDAIKTAVHTCHEFVDTFSDEFRNILLFGSTGVGKTFLSHCIAKELMDASYSVIYFSSSELFDFLGKNTFGKSDGPEHDAPEHIYDSDLLIIDDLGTEFFNRFTASQLFVCLNERILRKKSTIISTNLTLEDIEKIYSARIFSRISSNYTVLNLIGDDIRIQKKLLNLGGTKDVTP